MNRRSYTRRATPVDAIQWTGENWPAVADFVAEKLSRESHYGWPVPFGGKWLTVTTPTGERTAAPEDWIVRDHHNGLWVVPPQRFAVEYEPREG